MKKVKVKDFNRDEWTVLNFHTVKFKLHEKILVYGFHVKMKCFGKVINISTDLHAFSDEKIFKIKIVRIR